ncbi:hypothetical protein PUR49_32625 [Streptomyces sp. BE147]|uniref:hypothetical protein n=1 Tax=Streptomyces sp. BE147 TaxID=3002524 RepID=UPI002E782A71|nr:hypothetical protein [Streptomyces sp. BE147]MEE1741217.1 hypothetical protein [Streptomyces sp. BE147]
MATKGTPQPTSAAATYSLVLESASLLRDAIDRRYDRSASGYAAALTSLCTLYQVQLAKECAHCEGSGIVDGNSCPNIVAHPAS